MTRGRWSLLVVLLALAAAFGSLGRWQLERGRAKAAYLEDHAAALAREPVGFAAAFEAGVPVRVAGEGRYDDTVTVLLDNRVRDGRAGAEVLTLFRPADGSRALIVDRGWIPLPPDRSVAPLAPVGDAPTRVSGLLVAPPSTGLELGTLRFARGEPPPLWPRFDLEVLERATGVPLARAVVLLDDDAENGYARGWRPLPNTLPPERHRGYAMQWFALAATVVVVALVMVFRR